ncbi:hypothetical protein K443DRAFT_15094 [Laccaria amethystina LaAM-08-1]|uniref:Unplaced genomic scaffold K443scaffold_613, whole genome shotgun sequence n=1 Tax=Laccaria amethystina LaAM-08-1 TaxID=1095629 RepID=A0A0C9WRR4_9AGAR|nr:hypothetical protein K443DRAFT_15094 [Laccaria amethystina LaAM-08-1]
MRDLPPMAGAIIYARQIERHLHTYMKHVEDVLGKGWCRRSKAAIQFLSSACHRLPEPERIHLPVSDVASNRRGGDKRMKAEKAWCRQRYPSNACLLHGAALFWNRYADEMTRKTFWPVRV